MRKHEQRNILELLQTFFEANNEIKKFALRNETAFVVGILADCQEAAQGLIGYIEDIAGEGTATAALLEAYYILLYEASVAESCDILGFMHRLKRQLVLIESKVRDELKPDKLEIAFLPYQLSMFDCMESVYLAAASDPACEAYVVPIPYYDKNPDKSFGKMHYGEEYQEYIPITDWRKYDIGERRPDVIFIHNPYDNINHSTSVHPNYYAKRLREQTELLCYLPYYVATQGMREEFAQNPGCVYSHRIFVPSEQAKDNLVHNYRKQIGNAFGKPKDKFIVLGSPKFDAAITPRPGGYALPEAWSNLIETADGKKRVILYNTTIGALLGSEVYIKKLAFVLDTFKQRRDVVLWWRPHPLIEAIYKSILPLDEMLEYERLVSDYKRDGWGIYDDTPDSQRAIACSDAYYGDGGSLLEVYRVTGKPIMEQDIEIEHNKYKPYFLYCHDSETYLWFVEFTSNALMRMDKSTWGVEFICSISRKSKEGHSSDQLSYCKPVLYETSLYMTPLMEAAVAKYDINTSKLTYHPFDEGMFAQDVKFNYAFAYDGYVFFTPACFSAIMRMNTVTEEIQFFDDWYEPLKNRLDGKAAILFTDPVAVGSSIWLASCQTNAVVEFNMETCMHRIYNVGKREYRYFGIGYCGENFWLSPYNSNTPLVKWNPQTGEYKELDLSAYTTDASVDLQLFSSPVFCVGKLWLLPRFAKHALKIDVLTDEVSVAEEFEADCRAMADWTILKYIWVQVSNSSIYTYIEKDRSLIQYNCETNEWRKEALACPPEAAQRIDALAAKSFLLDEETQVEENCIYCENPSVRLDDYLNYITEYGERAEEKAMAAKRAQIARSRNANSDGTAGEAVYAYVKKQIFGHGGTT